jgi:hypothetical protein
MQNEKKRAMESSPENPFAVPHQEAACFALEHYQSLHYHALRTAAQGAFVRTLPDHLNVTSLKADAEMFGPDVYLRHPDEIRLLFAGITVPVFEAVQALYCSRLGRGIRTVWKILCAMADAAQAPPPFYEAIWALCLYFEGARRVQTAVGVERGAETWWIVILSAAIHLARKHTVMRERWSLVCCADLASEHVLAFRCVCDADVENSLSGVLYDALVAQRRPGPSLPTGLLWHVPKHLVMAAPVPQKCQTFCQQLGVAIESASTVPPLFSAIEQAWNRELAGQVVEARYYAFLFDTVLQKMQGYGPRRAQRERERDYHRLIGYRADPAWQFPLLRELLVSHSTTITQEGMISFNGLHYAHPLLWYWPGVPVTLHLPVETEARLWIFVENEILCQAYAQELRRSDGSYRAWRPERA